MLTVAVLGAVEARRDGELLPVPSGKTTELLARLALEPGTRVRADVLLDELWPAGAGRNTLQSKVSQLRRALGDKELVAGTAEAYLLELGRDSVDAFRSIDLAGETAAARRAGDAATALAKGREALSLFRGDVLVEAGDWALPHRARLEEVRLGLLEAVLAAQVDLGASGEVVGELESLVDRHPLREGLWETLVTALYRAGRQADALAAYARVRRLLVDELGIEPGPGLQALEQQVLTQSVAIDQGRSVTAPGNLPDLPGPLVGREDDVAELSSLVADHRLVTIVGPAGVGKTRLALELAHELRAAGGVWLLRLDAVDSSADLLRVLAETLHVTAGEDSVRDRLQGAETVLLLDNCEHLVESVSHLVGWLLEAAPRVRLLATSQVSLGLEGEQVSPLEPLTSEASIALFATRAAQMRQQFTLDAETTASVEEVCRSLDGLPLAIELAAARVRSLSVGDIARRLDDRFVLLRDPTSHRPERRRALASAIAWSYELLFPDDQRGLWALSCFAGSASLDATEHVLAALEVPAASVLDTISRLVDRSLVIVDEAPGGAVRYRLLDSIRAYAYERLAEFGLAGVAAAAHAGWYAGTADWCEAHVRSVHQPECLRIVRAERANIDSTLAWCSQHDPDLGVRVANGFGWTWVVLGDGTAGAARVRGALTPETPDHDRATGCLLAGWLEASAGDVALAQADLDTAGTIADALGDEVLLADVRRHRAFLAIQQGRPDAVLSYAEASLATYRALSRPWDVGGTLLLSAFGRLMVGDTAASTRDATEAVELLTPIGDSWGLVHAEAMIGGIAQAEHRFEEAARALSRAADESRTLGFLGQAALHLATLARVQQRAGLAEHADESFARAIAAAATVGDGRLAATARLNLARLRRAEGDVPAATALLEENERWYDEAGGGDGALLSRCLLAAATDDHDSLDLVLAEATTHEIDEVRVQALDALARLAAEPGRARDLLAEADELAPAVAHLVDEADRLDKALALVVLENRGPAAG